MITIVNLLTFGILFSSIISITSNNPIISIIFLITAFVNAAGYLILLGINFIGISYIVIYVGAIAVLFLFIILMINIKLTDILDTGYNFTKNLPLGLNIASLLLFIFFSTLPASPAVPQFGSSNLSVNAIAGNAYLESTSQLESSLAGVVGATPNPKVNRDLQIISYINESSANVTTSQPWQSKYAGVSTPPFSNGGWEVPGENFDVNLLEFTQIEVLGQILYTYASIFLIILSLILLLAMLAIIIISKKNITNI
jgi:NADH-ubiquinone oxidoreductase chain 6